MKKVFLIPLILSSAFMMATACSEDEPAADGQEQTIPGEDDGDPAWLEELGASRETSLGGIDNVEEDELRTALGEGSVTVTFSLDNNG